MSADWVPTARLRWVKKDEPTAGLAIGGIVLQQWFSQDVPGYMRRDAEGEWRDVPLQEATAP